MSAPDPGRLQAALDRFEILEVLQGWGFWRDDGQWERLTQAYTPDGRMHTSWFSGLARDFIAQSAARAAASPGGSLHITGPSTIRINGDRAVAETQVILIARSVQHGVEVDLTAILRFLDRLVRGERWQIAERYPIYERDRIDAVHPGETPQIDVARAAQFAQPCRYISYITTPVGAPAPVLATVGSDLAAKLRADADAWLAAG